MATLNLDDLKPEDVQKVLEFVLTLSDNFDDFENATINALADIFDYPISTYTIFDTTVDDEFFISKNFSNFFRKRDLDYYGFNAYKDDVAYQNVFINRTLNSSKYIFVTEYQKDSNNAFSREMIKNGTQYQIRLGSNTMVDPPMHVLCVYKAIQPNPIDEYELKLLNVIATLFPDHSDQVSEILGRVGHSNHMNVIFLRSAKNLSDKGCPRGDILQHIFIFSGDGHDIYKHGNLILTVDAGVISFNHSVVFQLLNTFLCCHAGHSDLISKLPEAHTRISLQEIQDHHVCLVHKPRHLPVNAAGRSFFVPHVMFSASTLNKPSIKGGYMIFKRHGCES